MENINWHFLVKKLLDTLMISQEELAQKCGVSQQSISNWSNGRREPNVFAKRPLLEIFKENLYHLYPASELEKPLKAKNNSAPFPLLSGAKYTSDEIAKFSHIFAHLTAKQDATFQEMKKRKETEEKLKKTESASHFYQKYSSELVCSLSIDKLEFLRVSPTITEIAGYSSGELSGRTMFDLACKEDIGELKNFQKELKIKAGIKLRNWVKGIWRISRKDGTNIWLETKCNSIKSEKNTPSEAFAISKDITAQKNLEGAIQKLEERLILITRNLKEAVIIQSLDSKVLWATASCKQTLGYPPYEIIGSDFWEKVHKDDRKIIYKILQELGQKSFNKRRAIRIRQKNGAYIRIHAAFKYEKNYDGQPVIFCVLREASDMQKHKDVIDYRDNLLEAVNSATGWFFSGKSEKAIKRALIIASEAVKADKAGIFQIHRKTPKGARLASLRYEWDNLKSEFLKNPKTLNNLPFGAGFAHCFRAFKQRNPVKMSLKKCSSKERKFIERQNAISILVAPVYNGSRLWGFICFKACKNNRIWRSPEAAFLGILGNAFGSIVESRDFLKERVNQNT